MSGLHNLNKPFFRSDYGLVVCLLVVFAYASLKEAWKPTTPHGREGCILAPCKA